jgi:hypothetical protein
MNKRILIELHLSICRSNLYDTCSISLSSYEKDEELQDVTQNESNLYISDLFHEVTVAVIPI